MIAAARTPHLLLTMLLALLLPTAPADAQAPAPPPLKWCTLPPPRNVLGNWSSPQMVRTDFNKDGSAEVLVTGRLRSQVFLPASGGVVPIFDGVYLFQSAAAGSAEVELSITMLMFREAPQLEGQGCTAEVKQTLRVSGREAAFFSADSDFGKAFLGFYRKHGATEAQLGTLIPRYRCADPPQCTQWETTIVPVELLLAPAPATSPTPTPVPSPSR